MTTEPHPSNIEGCASEVTKRRKKRDDLAQIKDGGDFQYSDVEINSWIKYRHVLVPSGCFNIDTGKTWSYAAGPKSLFGQSVMQYKDNLEKGAGSSNPWCFISNCVPNQKIEWYSVYSLVMEQNKPNNLFGKKEDLKNTVHGADRKTYCELLYTTRHDTGHSYIPELPHWSAEQGAGPERTVHQMDQKSSTLLLCRDASLPILPALAAAVRAGHGCQISSNMMEIKNDPKKMNNYINENSNNNNNNYDEGGTEIAVVLDGSGSINGTDFQKAKKFILNLMTKIWEKCSECEFAVVQYGNVIQTEFDIQDSRRDSSYILQKAENIEQGLKCLKHFEIVSNSYNPLCISICLSAGTKGDSLEFDLAQIGFAAHIKDKDTVVLGAVGTFDWSGGLMIASTETQKVTFLNDSSEDATRAAYGYLGYSVTTAKGKHTFLYIAGAPRHSNVGKVLVFEEDITTHHLSQILVGEQVGSYFGHQLCALDVKSDGIVNFLLVGAPFYHVKAEEGRVYVYRLTDEGKFSLHFTLYQHHYSYARFGYSIAKIGDVNQDGYQDIAIGAPLEGKFEEPESFGSVYIYNSNADSINTTPSQRIRATDCRQKLQFFGQSVDGGLDLTEDGYTDIAVGSLGNVMVLRSRPVVKAKATLQFQPEKIPLSYADKIVIASLCFDITPFEKLEFKKTYLYYELELDVFIEEKRIAFNTESSSRGKLYLLSDRCTKPINLTVLHCSYNCFTSIGIKVSYSMTATEQNRDLPSPVLDFYNTNYTFIELPYEKDCNNKSVCTPVLHLTTTMSRQELIVGYTKDLTMTLQLNNTGDDSYMTTVTLIYPKNLQFNTIKLANNFSVKCYEQKIPNLYNSTLNCQIQHPVFKSGNEKFDIIWQLSEERFSAAEAIIYSIVSKQPNALYVKIPPESPIEEEIEFTFNINGENQYDAELSLEIQIPITMKSKTISAISQPEKIQNSTLCKLENQKCRCRNASRKYKEEDLTCLVIQCNIYSVQEEIKVKAKLFLQTLQKLVEDTQELNITGELLYNKDLFVNIKDPELHKQMTVTILKEKVVNILPVIIGSSIGGILLLMIIVVILVKCGFFKRKYKQLDPNQY
ncbi:PREDICTED: integrin alpha-E [Nanorana parkeri]|uniref:integrin alpha-E n=1 Tax=Nanorana parkeri TaxID=125878 RepID=UPI0008543F68|nr:PREDICTED: integrin alpha-E [Nanorana parkeri]